MAKLAGNNLCQLNSNSHNRPEMLKLVAELGPMLLLLLQLVVHNLAGAQPAKIKAKMLRFRE